MKYFKIVDFYTDRNADRIGINNKPSEKYIENIMELCHDFLVPLRSSWGIFCKENKYNDSGWTILAGYRCDELNKYYDGKKSSPHLKGFAVDIRLNNGMYLPFLNFSKMWYISNNIRFDEIILVEKSNYIHLSIKNNEGKQRCHIVKK